MPMTMAERILARCSGSDAVHPGQIVQVDVALATVDEIQIRIFQKVFDQIATEVWDRERAVVIVDHYLPPSSIDQAEAVKMVREFGKKHDLRFTLLTEGIKHQVFRALRMVAPGTVVVATDSHTNTAGALGAFATALGPSDVAAVFRDGRTWLKVPPTIRIELTGALSPAVSARDVGQSLLGEYGSKFARGKAIEFGGPVISEMSLDARMTLTNLTTEMTAMAGLVEPDEKVAAYASELDIPYEILGPDDDAEYEQVLRIDVSDIEPLVALPHHPTNVAPVHEVAGVEINQAFVGTCTNGRYEDLEVVARVLKGRKVHPKVQFLIVPASRHDYLRAMQDGLFEVMMDAGAIIENANCGPCAGLHQGTLASNEVMIAAQPRNFRGRSGDNSAQIYLASPATVAASAIEGRVADPRPYLEE